MFKKEEKNIIDMLDKIFFQRMCAEEIDLKELKTFVANKQLLKLSDQIGQKLDEWESFPPKEYADWIELGRIESINKILKNGILNNLDNLDGYISIIDACNVVLSGEENCDIIIGKSTEDELQIYVYNMMKKFEEVNDPIEFSFQKKK